MPTSLTSEFETWLTTSGDGDSAIAISPPATARDAAAPVSNARTSTSTPCFLKKPSLSATIAITPANIGGIPGTAKVSFGACAPAVAGASASVAARHAVPSALIDTKLLILMLMLPPDPGGK